MDNGPRSDGELDPVFTDWDIAVKEDSISHGTNERTGTPAYMADALLKGGKPGNPPMKPAWYDDVESAFWLCYVASIRYDESDDARHQFHNFYNNKACSRMAVQP